MCTDDEEGVSAKPGDVPASRRPEPLGSRLVWWVALVSIFSFLAGLIGVAFSTVFVWDESYTPPSCFELVDDLGSGWLLLAVFAGPLLTAITLMAASTKVVTVGRSGLGVAFSSRLVATGLVVITAAPISAYALIDAGYREGIRGKYEIADRAACVAQLLSPVASWSTVAAIVIGCLALGRTMVSGH